jgi:hypothetical protein
VPGIKFYENLTLFELLRFDMHGEVNIRISATLGMTVVLFQLGVLKMKKCSGIRIRGVGIRNANFRNTGTLKSEYLIYRSHCHTYYLKKLQGLFRQRTIPSKRPPLVGEVSANFSG